jgi:hypothetical protein
LPSGEIAVTVELGVRASVGFASKTGPRKHNEDFAGTLFGAELPEPRQEVIAAIADGIGGAKGGRIAAETAVRGFLDGFCDLPETWRCNRAGSKIISALNGWINTIGRQDPNVAQGCPEKSNRLYAALVAQLPIPLGRACPTAVRLRKPGVPNDPYTTKDPPWPGLTRPSTPSWVR